VAQQIFFGDIEQPHAYSYVRDIARGLVTPGQHDAAFGETWHLPAADTRSTRQLVGLFEDNIGQTIQTRTPGGFMSRVTGLSNPSVREFTKMMYQWQKPFRVDDSKFRAAFGDTTTPHRDAVSATVAWYRQHMSAETD
jgi:nucleoside-diphosphate-sugar epimerase